MGAVSRLIRQPNCLTTMWWRRMVSRSRITILIGSFSRSRDPNSFRRSKSSRVGRIARLVINHFSQFPIFIRWAKWRKKLYTCTLRMSTCSICLADVRSTRKNSPIRCGHIFHTHCLERWKEQGKNTCPTCRRVFDVSQFKVEVRIHNNHTNTSNVVSLNDESMLSVLDLFDISFDIDNLPDLDSILSDLGVSLSDFDSSVFNTEWTTIFVIV